MKRNKSARLYKEAQKMFPGGVHSPVRAFKSVDGPPIFIKKGKGCHITDVDNNEYIDFCCSWGPLILGHNHKAIRTTLNKNLKNGTSFGTPTALGNEIGKLLLKNHRYLDMVRFVSSGTEAVMSAIRLARGYTGKNKIIKFEGCYHGHVDSLLVKAGSGLATFGVSTSAGIPESFAKETIVLPLNDLAACEKVLKKNKDVAAIIIEPIPANNGLLLQNKSYLKGLRKLCDKYGALLIFDEVISGFRAGFEGASGHYNIKPDLITFGKIIGGGLPVGAFGGKEKIMKKVAPLGDVYQAGTLSANPLAISAGIATLKELLKKGFYSKLEDKTQYFVNLISKHIKTKKYKVRIQTIGSIFWFSFSNKRAITADDINPEKMSLFRKMHAELLNQGVYLGPSGYEVGFVSAAHDKKTLKKAAKLINAAFDKVMHK
ncbi:MAG: glutamate-1-semialdehyde 2,1-aminomutase [Saprospiraceae bacterium]|nr:glutamate-1-semialdehyde 2,1-aminomutase [Saprospiraceae bacterium]